jgi:YHS domain-containing protein
MIALSFGCSKKKEEAPKTEAAPTAEAAGSNQPQVRDDGYKMVAGYDPVSREEVDIETSPYTYGYKGKGYYFNSAENLEAFKANPEKSWVHTNRANTVCVLTDGTRVLE